MGKFNKLFKFNVMIIRVASNLLTFLRFFKNKSMKSNRIRWNQEKSVIRNKKISILALGPSLDLNKIDKKNDIIVVNHFYKIQSNNQVIPKYYILYDPVFFSDEFMEKLKKLLKDFDSTIFVLNGKFYHKVKQHIGDSDRILYVNGWGSFRFLKKYKSFTGLMPPFNNVIHVAIYMSLVLGYKELNLYGLNYNLFCNENLKHAYAETKERDYDLISLLFQYSFTTYFHKVISEIAIDNDVTIYNRYIDSLLQTYEKESNDG